MAADALNHLVAEGSWLDSPERRGTRSLEGISKPDSGPAARVSAVVVTDGRPLLVDSGWIVPIGRPDRRCGVSRGGRGLNFALPTLVTGFIRPVRPSLSLQVRGCYLQLNTGSGTAGGVPVGEDLRLGSPDTAGDLDGARSGGVGWMGFLGRDVEEYQW